MHATYGVIVGGGGAAIPPLVSGGSEGILPSVVFPPSVIFPPCANAGANIDIPPTDAATVAKISLFLFTSFWFIGEVLFSSEVDRASFWIFINQLV